MVKDEENVYKILEQLRDEVDGKDISNMPEQIQIAIELLQIVNAIKESQDETD